MKVQQFRTGPNAQQSTIVCRWGEEGSLDVAAADVGARIST